MLHCISLIQGNSPRCFFGFLGGREEFYYKVIELKYLSEFAISFRQLIHLSSYVSQSSRHRGGSLRRKRYLRSLIGLCPIEHNVFAKFYFIGCSFLIPRHRVWRKKTKRHCSWRIATVSTERGSRMRKLLSDETRTYSRSRA